MELKIKNISFWSCIIEQHLIYTKSSGQVLNKSSVSFGVEQPVTKIELNGSYLLVGIGLFFFYFWYLSRTCIKLLELKGNGVLQKRKMLSENVKCMWLFNGSSSTPFVEYPINLVLLGWNAKNNSLILNA